MKKTAFIAGVMVLLFSASALAAIPVEVTVGKGTVLTLKENAKRVSLTDPSVAELILISPTEVLLNGKKIGTTSLITWNEDGKRTFFDVMVFGDMEQVLLEVRVAQIDRTKLKELGLSFLVKGIGGNAEVTAPGFVATPDGFLGSSNPATTTTGTATSTTGTAGLDVGPGITGFDLGELTPQIGVAHFPTGISIFLRALQSNGLAKILAEPNLIVRSGEKGEFHVGTRVPVQQVEGIGADQTVAIEFEEVGIRLNFAPQVLGDGTIRLRIDPAEVSNIQQFLTFQNIIAPVIDTRTVRTSVDLKDGESLVLAGLLSEETKKNIQKIPLLGDIPIFGALFRSTRDELVNKELAFFITPKLVKPLPPGAERPKLPGEGEPTPAEERAFDWIPLSPPSMR